MAKQSKKKKNVQINPVGEAHIQASFNNIIISLCNDKGQVISWSSAGKMGFRGSKKNTPYAAQVAAEDCSKEAFEFGLRKVKVFVKGPGAGRESAIRSIHNSGLLVSEIVDVTDTSLVKVRFSTAYANSSATRIRGNSTRNYTYFTFTRIADT